MAKAVGDNELHIGSEALLAITNDVASLMRRFYGKGPARSRAFLNQDLLFLVLEDVLTDFEQTFLAKGDSATVRLIRTRYQELIRDEMVFIIETHSGHRVVDYMSQILTDAAMLVEIILLAPPGDRSGDDSRYTPPTEASR